MTETADIPTRTKPQIDTGPGRTKQSFKDECDVNFIMNRWQRTGEMPANMAGTIKPVYGDFTNGDDYMTACQHVIDAESAFASLPAFLRDRFNNEPAHLLNFVADPENQEEAENLGLIERRPPEPDPEPTPEPEGTPEPPPPGE